MENSFSAAHENKKLVVPKKPNYTVHPAPFPLDSPGFRQFNKSAWIVTLVAVPLVPLFFFSTPLWTFPLWFVLTVVPTFVSFAVFDSILKSRSFQATAKTAGLKLVDYFTFQDKNFSSKFSGKSHIPIETFYEAYFANKLDINCDMLDLLENRHDWASFNFTSGHLKFLFENFVHEVIVHSRKQDEKQVRDHYDRGNDFYEAFLGPMMIYTSGLISRPDERETLEQLQENKLKNVLDKIQLKKGEKLLDIGCGWGTLVAYAAKHYGAKTTGVTLAREQTEFGLKRAEEYGVSDKVKIMCSDYRDIPVSTAENGQKYNKITCLEMAEHVGVRKFDSFLSQVSELLEDDGMFYLQIAGLRRPWQYEDLTWGLFMNKYIFPGADASCPLAWVIQKLEYAGFEVKTVDTIGVHYSATLERWYRNWIKPENKAKMVPKYGESLWRVWEFFLAWSVVISRQGSATCYQIVCHKNSNTFNRANLIKPTNSSVVATSN